MAPTVFETDRLLVRLYEPEDAPFVLDMYSRWDVQRFLGASPKLTLRSGEPIGTVLLKMAPLTSEQRPMPLSNDHEVGWHLHPDHWGHGYATETAAGTLQRAFDAGIDEVVALIVPGNERSVHVGERLGMQHLGLTDRYYGIKAHLYQSAR